MKSPRGDLAALALAVSLLLGGCASDDPVEDQAIWRATLIRHREQKDAEFKHSSTSPMAGTQYLKSQPERQVFLTREAGVFALGYTASPDAVLHVTREANAWTWSALERGITCHAGEVAVADGAALEGPVVFSISRFSLRFFPGDDRVTFIVFDPDRPERLSFEQLLYFPPDPSYAVRATLVELREPEEVQMLTSRNLEKNFYRFARVRFQIEGWDQELTAYKYALVGEGSNALFIPFRDGTTGVETYGAGRFLELEQPVDASFLLDFNLSFNPLCNYSPAYNCAIPPRENHLEVSLRAGELTYPSHTVH